MRGVDAQPSSLRAVDAADRTGAPAAESAAQPGLYPPFRVCLSPLRDRQMHDLNFLYYPQFLTADSRRYYNDQIERARHRGRSHCGRFIRHQTRSHQVTKCPRGQNQRGVARARSAFSPIEPAAARARGCICPITSSCSSGTVEPRKNVAGMLRAYRQWRDRDAHAPSLLLAGSRGWLFDETQALINQLNLLDNGRWIDSPPAADLVASCAMRPVCACCPRVDEGFGLTVLEAMACGVHPHQ